MVKKKKKKKPTYQCRRHKSSIPGLGRSPGGGHGSPYFSILAWRMLLIEEHGGLPSIGLQKVRHHWSDLTLKEFTHLLKVKWEIIVRFWTED